MAVSMPVCLLLFLLFATALGESSIRARANLPVFQFFSRTGHHVLDEEIPKITIPEVSIPIEGGPGHGKVTAKNMKIVKFQSPKFDFALLRDGLQWISRGGAIKIGGDWQAEYTALIPISESGWMKAFASNIRVQLSAGLYPKEGRPQVNIGSCTADIGQLDIEIGGGVLPWLVNLFRTPISAAIKDQIHKQACTSAKDILLVEANDFLHALPLHIPLGSNFYVDYIFDQKPKITSDYVQSDISADVVYGNVSCVPTRTGQWTEAGPHPGMVTIWLSQSIPNCLLNSAHKGNLVQFTVSKDIPSLTNYLKTSCSLISVCIGKFFTKLKKDYPNKFVDLHFHTFQAPVLQMTPGQTLINTTFAVDLHINPREQNPDVLARLILTSNAVIEPFINGTKLVANINGTTVEAKEDFSKIGDVSKLFLSMFDKIFTVTSNVIVEALLHNGIPLPIIDNVTIANTTEIHLFDEYVRLNIDFEYE